MKDSFKLINNIWINEDKYCRECCSNCSYGCGQGCPLQVDGNCDRCEFNDGHSRY